VPESSNVNLTQANATLGSPPYMSPEQWCNPLSVGPRSDLYSLAVMAYEALTGRQPFIGPTIAAIGEQHCNSEVPPVGDQYPEALDRMFRRALAKNPSDRPVSALAFASELRAAALSRGPTDATHPTEPIVPLRRRRLWPLAAGAAAVFAGGIATYGVMTAGRDHGLALSPASAAHTVEPAPPQPAPIGPRGAVTRGAVPPAATAPATVLVEIQSTPPGADVFRIPSDTKVGTTPWRGELPSEDGTRLFLIRKIGFGERQVEIDLRTGGTRAVKLPRAIKKPAATTPPPASRAPARHEGEPIDPFRTGGT
jgi:serine/threonine protein kinase